MIEAIILSTFTFIIGGLVGALFTNPSGKVKRITNANYSVYMWKGFVDPSLTYVYSDKGNDIELTGDGVVFDENGHIIYVEKHDKA